MHPEPTSPAQHLAGPSSAIRAGAHALHGGLRWIAEALARRWPAFALGLLSGSLLLRAIGACWGVPVPSGDQVLFLPVAREWLEHHQFQHPFWAVPGALTRQYNWHGWLYPLVVAGFPTSRHAQTLLFGATMLSVASVAVFAVYARLARLSPGRRALLLLLVGAVASYQIGRPESLLTLLWGVALILERCLPGRRFDGAAALLLGVASVTQPLVSIAAAAVFVGYAGCVRPQLRAFCASVATVASGAPLVAFGLTSACSPLRVLDWVHGLRANAASVASRTDGGWHDALLYFVALPTLPLAISYLVLAALVARELWAKPHTPGLRRVSLAAAGALAVFIALTALRIPATVYNLVALAPPFVALAVGAAPGVPLRLALGTSGVAAAGSLAFGALSVLAATRGTAISELQAELRAIQPCSIAADPSSWLAVEEVVGRERMCDASSSCPARVILQANSGLLEPPASVGGLGLDRDRFHHAPPAVLGLSVETTRKDYAHALYAEPSHCTRLAAH